MLFIIPVLHGWLHARQELEAFGAVIEIVSSTADAADSAARGVDGTGKAESGTVDTLARSHEVVSASAASQLCQWELQVELLSEWRILLPINASLSNLQTLATQLEVHRH